MTEKRYEEVNRFMKDTLDVQILTVKQLKRDLNRGKGIDGEQLFDLIYNLHEENEQLKKQIKIFNIFLDGNNLQIDWNELCILDSCMMSDEVECRNCIYMGMDVLE